MTSFFLGKVRQVYWAGLYIPQQLYVCSRWLYQRYLVHYPVFRFVRHAPRRVLNLCPRIRAKNSHLLNSRRYQVCSRTEFIEGKGLDRVVFHSARTLPIDGPRFIGDYTFTPIGNARVDLKQPPLDAVEYHKATVMGGTNYTIINGFIIQPDMCDLRRDVCPAELNGIAQVDVGARTISLHIGSGDHVDEAISLLGCCTGNYAHWLTEILPKLLFVDSVERFDGYPLLVDQWIHPNFIASIELLKTQDRQLIRVPRWTSVRVAKLVDVSAPAYVPPEHRTFYERRLLAYPVPDDFPMSCIALRLLGERARQKLGLGPPRQRLKIFLRRKRGSTGNNRCIRNTSEVELMAEKHGYTLLDLAALSFNEQVTLFSQVTHIISPLGAALSNLIFSQQGAHVIGLSPYYDKANYYYFSNLMGALGHELHYVLGEQVEHDKVHPLHKDYVVSIAALEMALKALEA